MRKKVTLLALALNCIVLQAQDQIDFLCEDHTYVSNIATVQFGPAGFQHLFPLLTLGGQGQFLLSFDDLDAGAKNYVYSAIHCDRDWKPTDLSSLEYIEGFDEDNIYDYSFSFKTRHNYTHYELLFPNDNMDLAKTGNYIFVVFEDEDEKIPVITRRFVIVENQVNIGAQIVRPSKVSKIHTHQEIDFEINTARLNPHNPMMEFRATVLQNSRWDNAITDVSPKFIISNKISFDYQDKIVFPAGNEFRFLDLRSLRAPQSDINYVGLVNDKEVEAIMEPQISRKKAGVHLSYADINGAYIIENFDQRNELLNGEYPQVLFTYKVDQPYYQENVYFIGAITDWKIKRDYQLVYNPAISAYVGRFPFKMGYYNYFFATAPSEVDADEKMEVSTAKTEGNFADTENNYLILIYYRPFGSRYDQIIGSYQFNSSDR